MKLTLKQLRRVVMDIEYWIAQHPGAKEEPRFEIARSLPLTMDIDPSDEAVTVATIHTVTVERSVHGWMVDFGDGS